MSGCSFNNISKQFPNLLYLTETPSIGESNYREGIWRPASGGSGTREVVPLNNVPVKGVQEGFHISGTADDRSSTGVAIDGIPFEYGETYIFSCYAKGVGQLYLQHGKKPWVSKIYDVSNDWSRYSYVFMIGENDGSTLEDPSNNIYLGVNNKIDSDMLICGMKLEKVVPSLWTKNVDD